MRTKSLSLTVMMALIGLCLAGSQAFANQEIPQYLQTQVVKACEQASVQAPAKIDSDALLSLLNSPQDKVRYVAVYVLGDIREKRAASALVPMLTSSDANLRRMAAHALGKIGCQSAVLPLAYVLNTIDERPMVRCEAVKALSRIPGGQATRLIMAAYCENCPVLQRSKQVALNNRAKAESAIR